MPDPNLSTQATAPAQPQPQATRGVSEPLPQTTASASEPLPKTTGSESDDTEHDDTLTPYEFLLEPQSQTTGRWDMELGDTLTHDQFWDSIESAWHLISPLYDSIFTRFLRPEPHLYQLCDNIKSFLAVLKASQLESWCNNYDRAHSNIRRFIGPRGDLWAVYIVILGRGTRVVNAIASGLPVRFCVAIRDVIRKAKVKVEKCI